VNGARGERGESFSQSLGVVRLQGDGDDKDSGTRGPAKKDGKIGVKRNTRSFKDG